MKGIDIYLICGGCVLGLIVLAGLGWFLWTCWQIHKDKRKAKKRREEDDHIAG